jgi:hypothetical protein
LKAGEEAKAAGVLLAAEESSGKVRVRDAKAAQGLPDAAYRSWLRAEG